MGRFARLNGVQYRVWSPPGSPVRIEYSTALLRQMHLEAEHGNAAGTLFGVRLPGGFRVVAAQAQVRENDPLLAGLEQVGIFAARVRGEVFLTESDLERLEHHAVALVAVGENAGFFVREADGSIQAIQSYGEFSEPRPIKPPKRSTTPVVLLALACLGMFTAAFLAPRHPAPIALTIHAEQGRQLRIAWNRFGRGSLEITDGADRTAISISPDLASATYLTRTGDVRVQLRRNDGSHDDARFIGEGESPIARQVSELDSEASALRKVGESRRSRVEELERSIRRLTR